MPLRPLRDVVSVQPCSILEGGTAIVVNASNESALLGGGVSRALFEECGGDALQAEMSARLAADHGGVLEEGDCMVTTGCKSTRFEFILHVPSVDYRGPKARLDPSGRQVRTVTSEHRVRSCTTAALREAAALAASEGRPLGLTFPLLGAGSGGLSPAVAAHAMLKAMATFWAATPRASIDRIVLAVPEPDRRAAVAAELASL